jgi:hypothetical protein
MCSSTLTDNDQLVLNRLLIEFAYSAEAGWKVFKDPLTWIRGADRYRIKRELVELGVIHLDEQSSTTNTTTVAVSSNTQGDLAVAKWLAAKRKEEDYVAVNNFDDDFVLPPGVYERYFE